MNVILHGMRFLNGGGLEMHCRIVASSSVKQLEKDINDVIEQEKKEVIDVKIISSAHAPNFVALILLK